MKVKELINKLQKLDGDKEIFIYTDGNYMHEDGCYFCLVEDMDYDIEKTYFLKEEGGKYIRADFLLDEEKETQASIKKAKKYIKQDGGGPVVSEGYGYCFNL